MDTNIYPTKSIFKTTTRGQGVSRRPRASDRLPLAIGRAYERFLELSRVVVMAMLWMVGTAPLGSIALVLYLTMCLLLRLVAGSI